MMKATVIAATVLLAGPATGYVTLTQEQDLKVGEPDAVWVNSMRSLYEAVPLDYYDLPYPRPNSIIQDPSENLGQLLMGDKLQNTLYSFRINESKTCQFVGDKKKGTVKIFWDDAKKFISRINSKYRVHMMYQAMDLLTEMVVADKGMQTDHPYYQKGFQIGGKYTMAEGEKVQKYYLNNHIQFTFKYNTPNGKPEGDGSGKVFIVGFNAKVSSHADGCPTKKGRPDPGWVFDETMWNKTFPNSNREVKFTYEVFWEHKDAQWSGRFSEYISSLPDAHLEMTDNIKQSLLIMLLLTAIVAWILMRTLHLDFNRYNNPDNEEEMREEVGWKLVHTDVFRPPNHPNQLAAFVGTGVQLTGMVVSAIFFSLIGFVSPGARGNILAMMIFIYAILAIANGFVCGTLQMTFNVKQWKTPIASAIIYPGVVFILWGITECFLAAKHATSAVGFTVLFMLIAQWWGISLPLIVLGASIAYKRPPVTPPIPYRTIAKQIPPQSWIFSTPAIIFGPGLVTFVAVFLELKVIVSAIWQGRMYLLFGYIAILSLLVFVIVAEVTIVVIYYTLIYEDYRWWWKSVICNIGAGVFFFLWCVYFMFSSLHFGSLISHWLFFCFALIVSLAIMVVGGTIGFYSAWWFVTKIYNAIKIE
eukprot:TRINITY_DN634_c0_g1_i2.p1 TRINITY_DN634_c0_g1~~TRINITY_DN634_c0_g1_i2.p1  ORF type:complete len:643 (+),score=157.51 TRINITY_DN634_c0_g1_i2:102-2030(+)